MLIDFQIEKTKNMPFSLPPFEGKIQTPDPSKIAPPGPPGSVLCTFFLGLPLFSSSHLPIIFFFFVEIVAGN